MIRDKEDNWPHSQREARPKDYASRGSLKHPLGLGTHQVRMCRQTHVRARELAHVGRLPVQESMRNVRESCSCMQPEWA